MTAARGRGRVGRIPGFHPVDASDWLVSEIEHGGCRRGVLLYCVNTEWREKGDLSVLVQCTCKLTIALAKRHRLWRKTHEEEGLTGRAPNI